MNAGIKHNAFVLISALCILIVLAACSPANKPAAPGTGEATDFSEKKAATGSALEEPGQYGGKLTWNAGILAFGNPNDPHLVASGAGGRVYAGPIANGLLKRDPFDPKYPIIGDLAEKWGVSSDGRTYTFKLRQGVKFHNVPPGNGREFTSEDGKYNLMRMTADPSVVSEKNRVRFQRRTDFGEIQSIQAPDKYTLVVTLKEPYGPFLDSVSFPGSVMIPKEFIDTFEGGLILEGMIGTGPYIPTEYKRNQIVSYKRNPDHWQKNSQGNKLPYLDELSLINFTDTQAAVASFRARQLDVTAAGGKSTMDAVKRDMPDTKLLTGPRLAANNFRFNMKFKPFQDVRVRRAIHLAIDRHQFLDLLAEGVGVVTGPVTPIFPEMANTMDWLLSQPGYRRDKRQDLEEANRLMKEAGYGDGFVMSLLLSSGATAGDTASLLADQFKPLNITVKAEIVDYNGGWVPRSVRGEFELSSMGHVYNVDVDSALTPHVASDGGRNYGKFDDPVLDGLLSKERLGVTLEERRKWAQEVEKYIFENAPMVFTYAGGNMVLVQPWAHNVTATLLPAGEYGSVEWIWVEKR